MRFGPTNTLSFCTTMMKYFKDMWDKLFIFKLKTLGLLGVTKLVVTKLQEVFLGDIRVVSEIRTIINGILFWCSNKEPLSIYFG